MTTHKPPRWMGTNHPQSATEERLQRRYDELSEEQYSSHFFDPQAIFKIMGEELDKVQNEIERLKSP